MEQGYDMKIIKNYGSFSEVEQSGRMLLIDNDDLHLLEDNKISYDMSIGYFTYPGNKSKCYLHRLIANEPEGKQVDHKNGNKHDNRKSNLRVCTEKQNKRNITGRKGESIYRGVYWHKQNENWATNVCFNGKKYVCGSYDNEVDAAIAVDKKIDEIYFDKTFKNFPVPKEEATAYIGGTFDCLHFGHIELFKNTKKIANRIVVALNTDEFVERYKNRKTIVSLKNRIEMLKANKYVDDVVVNIGDEDSSKSIMVVRPQYIIHGDDWTGDSLLEQLGITKNFLSIYETYLVYMPYTKDISTTLIRSKLNL